MNFFNSKHTIHVEVCMKQGVRYDEAVLQKDLTAYIATERPSMGILTNINNEGITKWPELINVESLLLESEALRVGKVQNEDLEHLIYHTYTPHRRAMELEMFESEGGDDGDSSAVPSSSHWILPSNAFVDLWQHLIYEPGLKDKLLKFALSALTFSQHNVNQNIICCNRLLLLHGPPGTGKTSLCKALAQKLAVRTSHRYRHTHLIEINSHSLFSKWFSESGKLVMRLFSQIREIVADSGNLVCVLIDEVESIAYARDCMSGQEPKDAMRVVNALLTQLDSIKENANVLILATSNLADSIDLAFLDRADIKQFIGLPNASAVRQIYESMLREMMRVGLVREESLTADDKHEGLLQQLAERSVGLSGRTLRKLPYLAHAVHAGSGQFGSEEKIQLGDFLDAMLEALQHHQKDHALMRN